MMNLYEAFYRKKLPEPLQSRTESFASVAESTGEMLFRIGFYVGLHFEEFKESIYESMEEARRDNPNA
jgi:hypothetical protein